MNVTKQLTNVEIKDATKGTVEAVFSRFNVIDHDGDVTMPDALTDGAKVIISAFNHASWSGALPVGKGSIRVDDDVAVLEGQFFMDTQHGRDTFQTVKDLEDLGEWSYSLHDVVADHGEFEGQPARILRKIRVHEVSPVIKGAGIGTQTLATKSDNLTISEQADAAVVAVDEFAERLAGVISYRRNQGKSAVSDETAVQIKALTDAVASVLKEIPETDPTETEQADDLEPLQLLYLERLRSNIPGVIQ